MRINYQEELNQEQQEVVFNGNGYCLVLAGAGSGKTRTITYRVAYLLEQGVSPANILLLTFTNKAAKEMVTRVERLLFEKTENSGLTSVGLWGGTFHSIANRLLRLYAPLIGRTSRFTILDDDDSKNLVKMCIKEVGADTAGRKFPSPAIVQGMISYHRNASKSLREVVENRFPSLEGSLPLLERVAELYQARKAQADAVDFDDLLLFLRELLWQRPDVREQLSSRFHYILVDEYQDTNTVQADIVRSLASVHENLLVVGDDAQSIYSFRAADIRNILQFPDTLPQAKVFRLVTNYRSTPEILSLANAVIRRNTAQFQKDLRAVQASAGKPCIIPASDSQQEARELAQHINNLQHKQVSLSEIAILFRASFLSRAVEFELMRQGIPYEYRGGMKFFERAHMKDVLAYLRVVANVKDEMAWRRVLGLQPGIGLAGSSRILEQIRAHEQFEHLLSQSLPSLGRSTQGWEQCLSILRPLAAAGDRPADMIRAVVSGGYRNYLEMEYPDFMERVEDLEQFALFAETAVDLHSFLDEVSLTEQFALQSSSQSGAVKRMVLSTIHQAKGLEWDAVFVMGLSDRHFPHPRSFEEEGGLEEERRLFYVAATRARKYLFLTYATSAGFDETVGEPSIFLRELPNSVCCEEISKRPSSSWSHSSSSERPHRNWESDEDRIIILDDEGERPASLSPRKGFLRDVNEL
ncbi:MAG: UvrD/rep helicase [Candidatus Uhrbacteria bacterium GW2011_GWF2_41_16]|uniref:DNA 3'-5' helicase n=2 Tax=Candidatus Uhriibacteriota TaxID=1752732 RepID=A0A0G0VFZ0_9BACT|nr:MAG: UvrD/rep helicase [Candidatus Uhrbacteria bacterium GW2011_GWA2_41_10]KKR87586.1 MAG: UvrD/rep helicase [Candidatus Uhrbacteria bacterium GW2011_GWC2_41_11]KKR98566.1 MAG: UvrD/rep helicase [Candidatus Uhrbacteria bacterium GW2011_GWF2_41_16]HBO99813.1 ATP-dependent DNA helicase [Candidatus Uhrbacteria bacterium]